MIAGINFVPIIDREQLSKEAIKEKLLELERQYHQETHKILQLFEYSDQSVFITGVDGELLEVNKRFALSYGYTDKDDVIGKNIMNFFSSETYGDVLDDMVDLYEHGIIAFRKRKAKGKGDVDFLMELRMVLLTDEFNKTIGMLGVIRDIAHSDVDEKDVKELKFLNAKLLESYEEIREYNKQLEQAHKKAEEYDRLKISFLSNISHEIRTPLNGIVGFAELLTRSSFSETQKQDYTSIIKESSIRLLNIINDLMEISQIESGKVEISRTRFSVNGLFIEVYKTYINDIQAKGLSFKLNSLLPEEVVFIETDKEKLGRIFYHLIGNALKFTSEGYIELGAMIKGKGIQFYVKDTGKGIDKTRSAQIFERFRKGEDDQSRFESGVGVGLALSKAYIEMLGGEIWLEPRTEKGTTFNISIPCGELCEKKEETSTGKWKINYSAMQWADKKILIVEDEEFNLAYLQEILKNTKVNVVYAITGREAIRIFESSDKIDLILLDIKLPDISGLEVSKYIKAKNPEVIIIAQTAYALESDKEKALSNGCNHYISKPIEPDMLLQTLDSFLSKKSN